jgi:signal transduction histidine kinase
MTSTRSLALLLLIVAAASGLFWLALHQISGFWLDIALRPEVRVALERSAEDQKTLRRLDPGHGATYRVRFEETRRLLRRLELLRMNREEMVERFELMLVLAFAVTAMLAVTASWLRQRRAQIRERTQFAERVTTLQETARRHAHEIKGPLTAARLELERLGDFPSVVEELDRLARFTREFSSFGGLGAPVLRRESLGAWIEEFCRTFAGAWPSVALEERGGDAIVCIDRDMLRQVLVNLCTNSAGAGATRVTFTIVKNGAHVMLDVRDDGAGIPPPLRAHIFDPYVTTKRIGEGMGLGLAISRKVLLDHGGDLALHDTSERGTTFRITFGDATCN